MKKTIPTSIAQTLFYVEEDSYEKLDHYLKTVREYFAQYADSIEIIQDIESRIREQLLEYTQVVQTNDRIINNEHIDMLIKTMGWPEEFGTDTEKEETIHHSKTTRERNQKKLYRDEDNKVIAGVASGIGVYFNIDPIIVRVLFFISIFFGGVGILIYIFFWFAIPLALTTTQKLEMHGERVTVNEVKKMIEEKIAEVGGKEKIKSNLAYFFTSIFSFIGTTGKQSIEILSKIFGVLFKCIALISVVGLVVGFLILSVNPISYLAGTTIPEFHSILSYYLILLTWFLCLLIPFIFLAIVGARLSGNKNKLTSPLTTILLVTWLFAIAFGGFFVFKITGGYIGTFESNNEFQEVILNPEIQSFSKLNIQNSQNVIISQGDVSAIEIRGGERDVMLTQFNYTDDTLTIRRDTPFNVCLFCHDRPSQIRVTIPALNTLSVKNGSNATVSGLFESLIVEAQNASFITLYGTSIKLEATLSNASHLDAKEFLIETGIFDLTNGSEAEVNVSTKLNAKITNGSELTQYGSASIQESELSNGSHIEKEDTDKKE